MANDDVSAGDRWARTVAEEIRRFKSLRPRPGRVLRYTPMPPSVRAELNKSLGIWPLPRSKRDGIVDLVAKQMAGLVGSFALRHGAAIPEPEAGRAAAVVEDEAFAAAAAYAAGKDLATEEERFEVFRTYVKELWSRAFRYAKSRPQQQAAGTSRAEPAGAGAVQAVPLPPGASVFVVAGAVQAVQQLGLPPASSRSRGVGQ